MFNRQALGILVIALALPAYADSPPEFMHRLREYPELIHRLNQHPEVIPKVNQHPEQHTLEQHSGTDVVDLQPLSSTAISFRMTANADVVYKTIGKLAGFNVIIDPDYRPQKITVELTDVTPREALDLIRLQSKTFWRPVLPNTIFVAADSAAKRKEVDKPKPEVVIDVAVGQVSRDRIRALGNMLPTSVSAAILPPGVSTTAASGGSTSSGAGALTLNTGGISGVGSFAVAIPSSATFTFLVSDT
jgi:hypothetical protein